MTQFVDKVMLEVDGESWMLNLVIISTDVARNMTVRHIVSVTRLAEGTFPCSYRSWFSAHQLYFVIQDFVSGLCEDTFYETLTALIGHLRRQQKQVANIISTYPTMDSTLCLSLVRVTTWLSKHREAVIRHLGEKEPSCAPSLSWWVMLLAM